MSFKFHLILGLLLLSACPYHAANSEDTLDQREQQLKKKYEDLKAESAWMDDKVNVYYTRSDLQAGHVIAETDLEEQEIYRDCAPADALRTKASLIGKKLSRKIQRAQIFSVRDIGLPLTASMKESMIAHKYPAGKYKNGKIVYAVQPIKAGTRFTSSQLAETTYPSRYIPQDGMTASSIVIGRKVRQDVPKFGIVTQRDLAIGE